ncbi:MAG: hypothetical protein PHC90_07300 [Syntrophorhabdaceae bacterium]|nr:hypothetical protein [Syntrophorhabdaceae bacterium]
MEIYCPQLGMIIGFDYCLHVQGDLPCGNTFGCWKERVDVAAVLKANFTDEELLLAFNTLPKSRLQRILESAQSARREE